MGKVKYFVVSACIVIFVFFFATAEEAATRNPCQLILTEEITVERTDALGRSAEEASEVIVGIEQDLTLIGRSPDQQYFIFAFRPDETMSTVYETIYGQVAITEDFEVVVREGLRHSTGDDETVITQKLDDCAPFWGLPEFEVLDLASDFTTGGIYDFSSWHAADVTGSNVRVGIIDARYADLDIFLNNLNAAQFRILTDGEIQEPAEGCIQNEVDEQGNTSLLDLCSPEPDHGTKVLRILHTIAPDATFYLTRTNNVDPTSAANSFASAVDALIEVDVDIIVHAANVITDSPEPYYQAVRSATDAGIFWINSAGNIGAGYYADEFTGVDETNAFVNWHLFTDPNRNRLQRSLRVPVNSGGRVTITTLWEQIPDPRIPEQNLNDFVLKTGSSVSLNSDQETFQERRNDQTSVQVPPIETIVYAPGELLHWLPGDELILPLIPGDDIRANDGIVEQNLLYLWMDIEDGVAQSGTRIEIFVQGALPAEYTPYAHQSLAPIVLVPGNMPDVLTVGAHDASNRLTWYSSRSNTYQFVQGEPTILDDNDQPYVPPFIIKPDITALGALEMLLNDDESIESSRDFVGTSAATPIIGGFAALLASQQRMDNPDAELDFNAIRAAITTQYVECLEDGAVGKLLPYLVLSTPDSEHSTQICNILDDPQWQSDHSDIIDSLDDSYEYAPALAQLIEIGSDNNIIGDAVTIRGTAQGYAFSRYILEIGAVMNETATAENWEIMTVTDVPPTTLPENRCTLPDEVGRSNEVDNGSLLDFDSRPYQDGTYIIRLYVCSGDRIVAQTQRQVTIGNRGEPRIELNAETYASLTNQPVLGKTTTLDSLLLAGTAQGRDVSHYVIQAIPDETSAVPIVNIVPNTTQELGDNVCAFGRDNTQQYGSPQDSGPIGQISSARFADGVYYLSVTLCTDDGTVIMNKEIMEYPFAIENIPEPLITITEPFDGSSLTGSLTIRGYAGGDKFTRYILRLLPVDEATNTTIDVDAIIIEPAQAPSSNIAELCALPTNETPSTEESRLPEGDLTKLEELPGASLARLDPVRLGLESRRYVLEAIICVDNQVYEVDTERFTTRVNIEIERDVFIPLALDLNQPEANLANNADIRGQVSGSRLTHYVLAIGVPDDTQEDTVKWVVPYLPSLPEDDGTCPFAYPSSVEYGLDAVSADGVVATFDTRQFANGEYRLRLRLCATEIEVEPAAPTAESTQEAEATETAEATDIPEATPEPQVIDDVPEPVEIIITIENPTDIRLEFPSEGSTIAGQHNLLGTILVPGLTHYTVELGFEEQGEISWQPIVDSLSTLESDNGACQFGEIVLDFGNTEVDGGIITPIIDTVKCPNGNYFVQIVAYIGETVAGEAVFGPFVIANDPPPFLEVNVSQSLDETTIPLVGSAFGDGYLGYTVEISPDRTNQIWTTLYPEGLTAIGTPESGNLCEDTRLRDMQMSPRFDENLYVIDQSAFVSDEYLVRVNLCVQLDDGSVIVQDSERLPVPIRNPQVIIEGEATIQQQVSSSSLATLVGTISVPEFDSYFVDIAINDEVPVWLTVDTRDAADELEDRCSTEIAEGLFGSYPVENGTLITIPTISLTEDPYIFRITVCRSDSEPVVRVLDTSIEPAELALVSFSTAPGRVIATTFLPNTVNLYSQPTISSSVTQVLSSGVNMELIARTSDNRWLQVELAETGVSGWIQIVSVYIHDENFNLEDLPFVDFVPDSNDSVFASRRYVYASDLSGSWQIYSLASAGAEPTQLTFDGVNEMPDVSPDGNRVVFSSNRDGNREIYIMNIDGSEQVNITHNAAEDYRPNWSPRSDKIVFESDRSGLRSLYVFEINTGNVYEITSNLNVPCCVDWSSSGQQIVFAAQSDVTTYSIYIADLQTLEVTRLTNTASLDVNPSWQPNGSWIVFESNRDGTRQIYIVTTDGRTITQLTTQGENIEPSWLNSNMIVFSSNRGGQFDLFTMSGTGGNQQSVLVETGADIAEN